MKKLKNRGVCLECGHYFYESAYQDVCPDCIREQELRDGEASPDEYEDVGEQLQEPWVM